jgi:hypothetical protein
MTQTPLYTWWHNTAINKTMSDLESTLVADMKKSALSRLSRKQKRRVQAAELIDELLEKSRETRKREKIEEAKAKKEQEERLRLAKQGENGHVEGDGQPSATGSNGHTEKESFREYDMDKAEKGLLSREIPK